MKLVLLWFCVIGSLVDIALGAPAEQNAENIENAENVDYRLNTDVEPIEYTIDLTPHFDNEGGNEPFTFDGSVIIQLQATKPNVKTITLHKEELDISEVSLATKSKYFPSFPWNVEKMAINNTTYDERTNKYSLTLEEPLAENKLYELTFKFKGKLRTDMKGFYRSSYKEGNETKYLASTQMQPMHARKVFPCFDEPRFKATFSISMNRPTHFQPTLSNTKILSSYQWRSDLVREHFEKTPKMSSYLVAFIVSEFQCRENDAKTFAVCSRPNAISQTEYSFDMGQKQLNKFDELFDYKYNTHISKMAMAAIPDFSAGAMENWGLLTYRETALLYEPEVSTAMAQQRVAAVVAHEQTHMWFGDLVTCEWWSNTWLNEGFARFFQTFGTAMVETTWGLDQQFVVEQLQSVFGPDSLEDSQALTHEVNTPDEIDDRFGSISYNKGASVIRMVEHTIGHDTFISALRNYLKANELSTSLPEKLYKAFQDEVHTGLDVTDFMSGWVTQPGYPVVNVNVFADRRTIALTQRKFLRNNPKHEDNTVWNIPISYATDKWNTNFTKTNAIVHLNSKSEQQHKLNDVAEWLVVNVQQTGYYRVNYDDASWKAIDKVLHDSHETIHVLNRAQLVDDALNLARASQLNYTQALHTIHYLKNETDYVPWLSAFNNFDFILARFKSDDAKIFKKFILGLLNKVYSHLGFYPKPDNDTRLDIYNRNNVLKYACKFGHEQCITDARAEFDKLLQTSHKIPVNLVPVVYCSVISEGSDKEWTYLWEKFQNENVAAEQVTILSALGCTKQANLITKYLDLILTDNIRLQDKYSALVSTLMQKENFELVLDYVLTNHQNITKVFETDNELPKILTQLIGRSTTSEQIEKLRKFVKENDLESNKNLKTALTNADFNLKWAEQNVPIIKDFVKEKEDEVPGSAMTHTISGAILVGLIFVSFFNYRFSLVIFCVIGPLIDTSLSAPSVQDIDSASNSTLEKVEKLNHRLNSDVVPVDYVIELTPYFNNETGKEAFTFDGNVKITLQATRADVKIITLHQEDLNISQQSLTLKSNLFPSFSWDLQSINIDHYEYDERTKKHSIILSEPLVENLLYDLVITYTGKLRTDMLGFYRSSYKDGNVTKWLASSKMEPGHARKAFPCFDEPKFKATFSIILNRPSHFAPSLSNTPLVTSSSLLASDLVRESFEKTPKMSTYLVAFIVSEFQCRETEDKTFGVCSRPNAYNQTEYSFEVGRKTLAKFDEIFDYKYSTHMSKLQMIAIPDFVSGAMENWGLVTYRETALLYDPNVSTARAQQRVGTVVAHEQTHMWWGNLVTCEWWSNLWLNEGFATYFEYFTTALVEKTWDLEQQFVVDELQSIFEADSLEDSHALTHDVESPSEVADRFDSVSYNKGGSVIRMFEHTFGYDIFIAALKYYLKTNALSTATPETLYAAFQEQLSNGLNVTEFMSGWISQPGYPVLNVNVSSDRKSIQISQRKFLRNNAEHQDKTLWHIPITYASNKENVDFKQTKTDTFFAEESRTIDLPEAIEWIVFNVQQTGYYRVNYDGATWAAIDKVLYTSPTTIHVHNRAQIVDDALSLARGHQHNYPQALNTIKYLRNETDYIPWLSAFNNFDFILARFKNEEAALFKDFVLDLLTNVYAHLGFYPKETDKRLDIYNRNNVLKYACKLGHKQCIDDARAEFDKLLQKNYKIPVNLVPVVYCSVISEGSDKEWTYLWEKFQKENVAAEQVTILNALGCTKQAHLITKYFDLILSDDIRLQDKHSALASTLTQQVNIDLALDFIVTNHKNITKAFESEKEVPKILSSCVARLTTSKQIEKVQAFITENKLESNEILKKAVKSAQSNLIWAEHNVPIIKDYLQKNPNSASTHTISCFILLSVIFISIFNC
ncbi:uncharacterized protein LOC129579438 [Sitodiplosis mosellana]|uniref:uncharacterized protein LOC129579438 n=1 Tax=Sitodiplosis mosellana TaxID=263140 RepID=UPI002444E737|nr:uncharacterized protein LOC129579438 [Sitodiplosis mosellana]